MARSVGSRCRRFRSLLTFVLFALVLGSLTQVASGTTGGAAQAAAAPQRTELTRLRTANTSFFREADGTYTAEIHSAPIHYQDGSGAWQNIDPRLVTTTGGGFGWKNAGGPFAAKFAALSRMSNLVSIQAGNQSVAFGPTGAKLSVAPSLVNGVLTYPNLFPNVDMRFEMRPSAVKELLVIKQRPSAAVSYRFPLSLTNLTPRLEATGEVSLLDPAGQVAFTIPVASMTDSAADTGSGEGAFSEQVPMSLDTSGATPVLVVTPSLAWLQDPARVYPVIVDPSVTKNPSLDTFIQTGITSSQASGSEFKVGTYDGGSTKARSLLKFPMTGLTGSKIHILSGTLSVWENWSYSCTAREVKVMRILDSWTSSVNWSNQPSVGTAADTVNAAKGFSGSCPEGRITFDVSNMVTNWSNGSLDNNGLELRAGDETDSLGWKRFDSSETSNDPRLIVSYDTEPDTPTSLSPSNGTSTSNQSPTFSAVYGDDDNGDSGHVTFTLTGPSNRTGQGSTVSPGGTSSWTPTTALPPGQYTWQAQATDGQFTSALTPAAPGRTLTITAPPPSAPTVTGGSTSWQSASSVTVMASGSVAGSGASIDHYEYRTSTDGGVTWSSTVANPAGQTGSTTITAEGETQVQFRTVDNLGTPSAWSPTTSGAGNTVRIDRTSPSAPAVSGGSLAWQSVSSVSVSGSGSTDTGGSGIDHYEYRTSADAGSTWSSATTGSTATITAEGSTIVQIRATDAAGNTSSWGPSSPNAGSSVKIDRTTPTAPSVSGGSGSWQSSSSVTVSATGSSDSGGSGLDHYEHRSSTDGGSTWSGGSTGASLAVTAEGETLVQFRSVDGASNLSAWTPSTATSGSTVRIDRTAPSAPTVSGGSLAWQQVASVTVGGSGSSDSGGSGLAQYEYRLSTDGGSSWGSPTTGSSDVVSAEGETIVQLRAVDSAGNVSSWAPSTAGAQNTVRLDRSAPMSPTVNGGSLAWQSAASITVTAGGASDSGGSGLDHYEYRGSTDGGTTWESAASGANDVVSSQGETLVQFRAVDLAGNTSSWAPSASGAANTVRIDRTAPTAPTVGGGSLSWQDVDSIVIAATGSTDSGGSGLNHYECRESTDGGTTWGTPSSGPTDTVTAEGETLVECRSIDNAANASDWAPATNGADNTARIDRSAALITSTTNPDPTQVYTGQTFDASWTGPSGLSSIQGYAVVIDDHADTIPATVTQTTTSIEQTDVSAGTHFLHVRAKATDGTWSATATFRFTIFNLVFPAPSTSTNQSLTLVAPVPSGAHDVVFQFRTDDNHTWSQVPNSRIQTAGGGSASLPVQGDAQTGNTAPLIWNAGDTSASDTGVGTNALDTIDGGLVVRAVMTASDGSTIATDPNYAVLDRRVPGPVTFNLPDSGNGVYVAGQAITATWTPASNDHVTGYSVVVDGSSTTQPDETVNTALNSATVNVSSSIKAVRYIHLRSVDTAGNWSSTQTVPLLFANAVLTAPSQGTTEDGTSPLTVKVATDMALHVCVEYETPGMTDWAVVPPSSVTVGGSAVGAWPFDVTANTLTTFNWGDFGSAVGIDNWAGQIALRAVTVGTSSSSCSSADAQQIQRTSILYTPASSGGGSAPTRLTPTADDGQGGGGNAVIFGVNSSTNITDFSINDDGSGQAPIGTAHVHGYPGGSASQDGTVIAHVGEESSSGCHQALIVDTPFGGETSHTIDGQIYSVAVSPDGSEIAYLTSDCTTNADEWTIWVTPVGSWSPTDFRQSDANASLGSVSFTPNSDELIWDSLPVQNNTVDIKVAPVDGSNASLPSGTLYSGPSCWWQCGSGLGLSASWSPDGQELAIQTGPNSLEIVDTPDGVSGVLDAGGSPSPSMTFDDSSVTGLSGYGYVLGPWSPDSSKLLLEQDNYPSEVMFSFDPFTGTSHDLYSVGGGNIYWVMPYAWTELPNDQSILASMYRPAIRLDSSEEWQPISPDQLLHETDSSSNPVNAKCAWYLKTWTTTGLTSTRGPAPNVTHNETEPYCTSLTTSSAPGAESSEIAQWQPPSDPLGDGSTLLTGYSKQLGVDGASNSAATYHSPFGSCDGSSLCDSVAGPIYYHVTTTPEMTYIQYWLFYRFNDATTVGLDSACSLASACDQHQGDWEGITVALSNAPQGAVQWVAYSQHGNWHRYSAQDMVDHQSSDDSGFVNVRHPIDYVAAGTHANYPDYCAGSCVNWDKLSLIPSGEANHNGTGPAFLANNDQVCAATCTANLNSADFMYSSFPLRWGLDPTHSCDGIDHCIVNSGLQQAPGGPDYPEPGHAENYDDPGGTPVSGAGHWQSDAESTWQSILDGLL